MYNTIDKSNEYYLWDLSNNKHSFIGNKDDLLRLLAGAFTYYGNYILPKNSDAWNNKYFDGVNITTKDVATNYVYEKLEDGSYEYKKNTSLRQFVFYDGNNRIADIRNLRKEAVKYNLEGKRVKRRARYNYHFHRSHKGGRYRNVNVKRILSYKAVPEYEKYVRKGYLNKFGYELLWSEFDTRISPCWKDQTKCKKQWEHRIKKKHEYVDKYDSYSYEEEFDIDALLEEDFLNNEI